MAETRHEMSHRSEGTPEPEEVVVDRSVPEGMKECLVAPYVEGDSQENSVSIQTPRVI
jgi:hypothetical protein